MPYKITITINDHVLRIFKKLFSWRVLEQCIFFIILTTALLFAGSQNLPITLAPNTLASATDVMNNFTFLKNRAWDLSGTDLYYNDGNVGVGTSTFVDRFHVANGNINLSTGWGIKWFDTSTMILGVSGGAGYLFFQTNSNERMRINSAGNVGIGTIAPGQRLDVMGNIRISASSRVMRDNTGTANVVAVAYGNINGADGSVNAAGSPDQPKSTSTPPRRLGRAGRRSADGIRGGSDDDFARVVRVAGVVVAQDRAHGVYRRVPEADPIPSGGTAQKQLQSDWPVRQRDRPGTGQGAADLLDPLGGGRSGG